MPLTWQNVPGLLQPRDISVLVGRKAPTLLKQLHWSFTIILQKEHFKTTEAFESTHDMNNILLTQNPKGEKCPYQTGFGEYVAGNLTLWITQSKLPGYLHIQCPRE